MQLCNRVFIVTGATSGLGAAVVKALACSDAKVIATGRNIERLHELWDDWHDVRVLAAEVTSETDAKALVRFAFDEFGALHGLVNCAGIAVAARVVGREAIHDLGTFVDVIGTNLVGTFNMIRWAAGAIADVQPDTDGERGVIINTASVAAFEGQIGQAAYAASKGGIVAMTLPIARELARFGIRVVTIAPGVFRTPMTDGMPEQVRSSLLAQSVSSFPRSFGQPEQFADLVKHVIQNRMINGETIRLDGAVRLGAR
jgi:NAD(P)-dependent dehydrogenase (short-subunit alcohol dehydrogenase family)